MRDDNSSKHFLTQQHIRWVQYITRIPTIIRKYFVVARGSLDCETVVGLMLTLNSYITCNNSIIIHFLS